MTFKEKLNETMSVQELIDILMTIEDKSQKVLVCAYPEWDNCSTEIPIKKDYIHSNDVCFEDDSKMAKVTTIYAEWFTDYDDEDDEEESEDEYKETKDNSEDMDYNDKRFYELSDNEIEEFIDTFEE